MVALSNCVNPVANGEFGPFISSANEWYVVGGNAIPPTDLVVQKAAADPTSSWTEQNSANRPGVASNNIEAWDVFQTGDDLHICFQDDTTGEVFYSRFDMAADAWVDLGTSDYDIQVVDPDVDYWARCRIYVSSDKEIQVVYQSDPVANMGADYERIDFRTSLDDGATWSSTLNLTTTAKNQLDYFLGDVVRGEARWHALYVDENGSANNILFNSILDNRNTETEIDTTVNTAYTAETFPNIGNAVSYVRASGTRIIRMAYQQDSTNDAEVLEFDSAQTPSFSESAINDINPKYNNLMWLAFVGSTLYYLVGNSADNDVYMANDGGNDSWGTFSAIATSASSLLDSISAVAYERSDTTYIGYFHAFNTRSTEYLEESVQPSALTQLDQADMAPQGDFYGPFEI